MRLVALRDLRNQYEANRENRNVGDPRWQFHRALVWTLIVRRRLSVKHVAVCFIVDRCSDFRLFSQPAESLLLVYAHRNAAHPRRAYDRRHHDLNCDVR
jgi:hypothetical protein